MIVIGIHNTGILSSAALVVDGKLAFGCAEERLDRRKHSKYFPHQAIGKALDWQGLTLADVDVFAIGWNPAINVAGRYRAGFSEWPAYPGERFSANPNHLLPRLGGAPHVATDQIFHREDGKPVQLTYVSHHLAHMTGAYCLSGFEESALFSCDGYGERDTTVWAVGRGTDIRILKRIEFPHSVGGFYSAITEFLGFRPDLDEWKVMGAAAYGDPEPYRTAMESMIRLVPDGGFHLDLDYFDHFNFDTPGYLTPAAHRLLGRPRHSGEAMEQRHFDIAAAAQARLEEVLRWALDWLRKETGCPRLCLSGGVAMNSLFNGRLSLDGPFDDVFVPFSPDDSGNSIGAALWAAQRAGDPVRNQTLTPFLGGSYDDEAIAGAIERCGLAATRIDDPAATAADLLAAGKIVGWFQGRMEFGQRALGGRSILASPRDPDMKDRLNSAVKFREGFRPFAPAVRAEDVGRFFEAPAGARVPFMEKVLPIRAERRQDIPAVVHADGSGRVQTVERSVQPLFHDLISAFGALTGVPVLVNTSFNLNGEPIVESPADAIRTYATSGMDALMLGRHLLSKR
ncbi:carbamoyltransferase C-terminal domain-containing protein [Azospirillum sp. TSO35-2]|uniref:carbamoyltransferase family protein n=1 Tax=Azospirillum sp. TSO35-2 TaxID=716796 RepID=UPI000D608C94|nr:carbamoyltransferase C-terminal domain-containing protein [Azospirillum sp. TSO35-2]PWC40634.1 hypothetical protein TSO352_00815 [Azospirillum sp. TSO35-2]